MAHVLLCNKCGCTLHHMGENNWACVICDLPDHYNPGFPVYRSHCWNCLPGGVDSRHSKKSSTPGMSYHCDFCGEDLEGWKKKMGLLRDNHAVL